MYIRRSFTREHETNDVSKRAEIWLTRIVLTCVRACVCDDTLRAFLSFLAGTARYIPLKFNLPSAFKNISVPALVPLHYY